MKFLVVVKPPYIYQMTSSSTYAGLVSREMVRISFKYTALRNLDIMAYDIHNAYLQDMIS